MPHTYSSELSFITIKEILINKLNSGEEYVEYVLSNFWFFIMENDSKIYPAFQDPLIELLGKGSKSVYKFIMQLGEEARFSMSTQFENAIELYNKHNK